MDTIPQGCPLVYVSFSAEINPSTTENLIAVMANCANLKVKKVTILLSTPGGGVMNGLNLYNVLKGMPFELTTHNVGNVDSIGNAVFLAGSTRYASARATFMFHGVGFDIPNNARLEEKDLQEKLEGLLNDQKRIGAIITDRTSITEGEVAELFRQAQTKDANYAVSKGIISEIREVNIAPGAPIVSLVFKR
ncbi:MAG: ATP-dependent Clp protease proteolytic subunit [Dehalococcoidales bacterium]|nr:ATP-dependent Clp protease proteolytic subunit [Dehalococcoidales bacterium]